MADSTASVTWSGSLLEGGGTIERVGSGVFGGLPITWDARTGEEGGKTTPENCQMLCKMDNRTKGGK